MQLHRAAREYATWAIADAPADATLQVSFDAGDTWHDLERPDPATARVLLAGPDTTSNPDGTNVLPAGAHRVLIRAADSPEDAVRYAGVVYVV